MHDRWKEYIRSAYASRIKTMNEMDVKNANKTCFRPLKHRHDRWIEYVRNT